MRFEAIAPLLLDWYGANARALPWRAPPGAPPPDPYRVWLSEIMLQQTTVAAVRPRFERFVARWPTVAALAAAREEDVLAEWAGLGYYARARNLLRCARAVAPHGFPDTEAELRRLPGVGEYTAAAIAAIAFGRRAVVVDANVARVVARLLAIRDPLPAARSAIREAADRVTPDRRAGDFAQAMMDLGAGVCTPRSPDCAACPLHAECRAFALGLANELPVRLRKPIRPYRRGACFWIERDGAVWLVRRAADRMLGGMRAPPDDGWTARHDGDGRPPAEGSWRAIGTVTHGFTHCRLDLAVHHGDAEPQGEGEWWPIAELAMAGLPTLFAKAARLASTAC